MERICPICKVNKNKKVYRQSFAKINNVTLLKNGYDVVVCENCGLVYANQIPTQKEFENYYEDMSKYEKDLNDYTDYTSSKQLMDRFNHRYFKVKPYINKDSDILEIGCATGDFLDFLQKKGYNNLQGIDPSPACVGFMKNIYHLDAEVSVISQIKGEEKYDLIMMIGVWEHIVDLDKSIKIIADLLKSNGILYIEIPNLDSFSVKTDLPFQEFSIEHVNFFSEHSIANLMGKENLFIENKELKNKYLDDLTVECLFVAFRKDMERTYVIKKDTKSEKIVQQYIAASWQAHYKAEEEIKVLAEQERQLVVWGVGTHTLRMLEQSSLKECNIVALIDSNPRYIGQYWNNIVVEPPENLGKYSNAVILLSTHRYQTEMVNKIRYEMKLRNEIISLY